MIPQPTIVTCPATSVTIACVWVGDKYGPEYVEILQDMVRRNLKPDRAVRFVCITDRPAELPEGVEPLEPEPSLPGWWNKLSLFKPGKLPAGRIAYFDLDVVITGELDTLVDTPGIIDDWNVPGYNSSVMVWDEGDHADIWAKRGEWGPDAFSDPLWGDQDLLTAVGGWETFPAPWCVSYKLNAKAWPPAGSKVVVFHGDPKPHTVLEGWVPAAWKLGGLTSIPHHKGMNVEVDRALENFHRAIERNDLHWFTGDMTKKGDCLIIGGSPSIGNWVSDIRTRQRRGATVVTMNGSLRWLRAKGMTPDAHVVLDARPENVEFVKDVPRNTEILVASQCHPSVIDYVVEHHPKNKRLLWHAYLSDAERQEEALDPWLETRPVCLIGGGCTVGLRAMYLVHLSGFRRLHIYGMDSCFQGDEHHGFAQPLNDGEEAIEIRMAGGSYRCSYWMAKQAQQFDEQLTSLANEGTRVWVHGKGLIPDIASIRNRELWRAAA